MSKSSKSQVRLVNPTAGREFVSLARARSLVRRGVAEWEGTRLLLDEAHYTRLSVMQCSTRTVRQGEGSGMATLEQVEGLPVAGQAIRLFTGHRSSRPVVDYSVIELGRFPVPVEEW